MLVLSRKENQRIVIGDDIKIVVVSVKGDKVRLGIDAPGNIPVHRQEVYDVIAREGQRKPSAKAERHVSEIEVDLSAIVPDPVSIGAEVADKWEEK